MGDEQMDDEQMDEQKENFYDDDAEELMVYTQKDYDDAEELMIQNEAKETRDYEQRMSWQRQHPEVDEKGNSPSRIIFCPPAEMEKEDPGSSSSSIPNDPTRGGIYLPNSPGGEEASRRYAEQIALPRRREGKYLDRSKGPITAMGRSKGKYLDRSEGKHLDRSKITATTPTPAPAAETQESSFQRTGEEAAAEAAAETAYLRAVRKYHRILCQCGNEAAKGCGQCGRCCPGCERHGRKVESSESEEEEEKESESEEAKDSEWWSARGHHPLAKQKGDGGSSSTDAVPPPPPADVEEDNATDHREDVIQDEDDFNDRMRILVMMLGQKKKLKKKKQERDDTDTEAQDVRNLREARDLLELRDLRKKTANWEPWRIQKEKNDRAQALLDQQAAVEAAGDIRGSQMEADGAPEEDEGARRGTRGGRRSHEADGAPYVPDVCEDEGARRDI